MRLFSLQGKILLSVFLSSVLGLLAVVAGNYFGVPQFVSLLSGVALALVACFISIGLFTRRIFLRLQALQGGLLNLLDDDYSTSITRDGTDELDELVDYYNQVSEKLRCERQSLYQRELLLDTVIQNSNLALLLTDSHQRIVYANSQASQFFCDGDAVQGLFLQQLLEKAPENFRVMIAEGKDGLVSITEESIPEVYHLSVGKFVLNTEEHKLYLIKQLTRDIGRKEIETWKKVIRVISHELNNSLAPISSMANTGKILLEKQQTEKLAMVFDTITERSNHLKHFIQDYIRLAKLPEPKIKEVAWSELVERLCQQYRFELIGDLPASVAYFDLGQMEQALINLLKNAHESESAVEDIQLGISQGREIVMTVLDRGRGISKATMENMLLPFYTTKPNGSGVGLPLCREIVEAHGGTMVVLQRQAGGVEARLVLPNQDQ
ncbi:sensor histidine kinase [Teredinibacter franksiae]|uniref:sensor histidine kinase n=1 Tax=Teredinibacter franksiae TaxID=2761453 RepID=UPI001624CB9D|nr:ATP-binding protein [Teredinibacter franksiae]